jgi:hypothetical protein
VLRVLSETNGTFFYIFFFVFLFYFILLFFFCFTIENFFSGRLGKNG